MIEAVVGELLGDRRATMTGDRGVFQGEIARGEIHIKPHGLTTMPKFAAGECLMQGILDNRATLI